MNPKTPATIVQLPGSAPPKTGATKILCDNCKKKRGCDEQSSCSNCKRQRLVTNQESSDSDPVVSPWKMLQSSTFFERPEVLKALVGPIDDSDDILGDLEIDLADEIKSRTPLHWAASNGYINIVKLLIEEFHMDINAQSAGGVTPLHLAAKNGHAKVVTLLGTYGADVEAVAFLCETPLYLAAKNGHVEVIKLLQTELGAQIDKFLPLHAAVENGHVDAVRLLIALGADKSNEFWTSPLESAAFSGHTEIVRLLISGPTMQTDAIIKALIGSVTKGHVDTLKLLLTEGHVHVNVQDDFGWTPLHAATACGHVSIARMLITEFHADKDALDNRGYTPLHSAVSCEHIEVAKILVTEYGANAYAKTKDHQTLLHLAAGNKKTKVVEWLIAEFGANLNTKDRLKQMPLHKAVGTWEIVELLGDSFGDIDVKDINGKTPLHLAAEDGEVLTVTLLVARFRAGVNIKDNLRRTPLHLAVKCQPWMRKYCIQVVRFLMNHVDTDINAVASNNMTPLEYATNVGFSGAVAVFKEYTQRLH